MHTSYVFLAEGFEEIEAITPVDVMRRAGMDVKTVSITDNHQVTGAHGMSVKADLTFKEADFENSEWLVLPGGLPGATNLAAFTPLTHLLTVHKGRIAAICASPAVVLAPLGLLEGKEATCYPSFSKEAEAHGAVMTDAPVVVLDSLITGNGPAAAMQFALAIVAKSMGPQMAREVAAGMLFAK